MQCLTKTIKRIIFSMGLNLGSVAGVMSRGLKNIPKPKLVI